MDLYASSNTMSVKCYKYKFKSGTYSPNNTTPLAHIKRIPEPLHRGEHGLHQADFAGHDWRVRASDDGAGGDGVVEDVAGGGGVD